MEARLSGIAGRESRAFPRPNITNASYVCACHRSLLVRLSPPADIRRSELTAGPVTFIPSAPIPGTGNKLPDPGHHCEFPAKKLFVEQQAERLKVLRLFNQDQESVRVQEAHLPIKPEPLPVLPTSPDHVTLPQPSESSSENSTLCLTIPEVRYSISKYIFRIS